MNLQLQSIINLQLMMDLTTPGPAVAPVLSIKTQKSHFLSATLPMDCVICTASDDTVRGSELAWVFFLISQWTNWLPCASTTPLPPCHLQSIRAPVEGSDWSAAWNGESDAAEHEGNDAAAPWTAPLPPPSAERTCYCGLSCRSAWQPTGNTAKGKTGSNLT